MHITYGSVSMVGYYSEYSMDKHSQDSYHLKVHKCINDKVWCSSNQLKYRPCPVCISHMI